jgi:hypothetical protein
MNVPPPFIHRGELRRIHAGVRFGDNTGHTTIAL